MERSNINMSERNAYLVNKVGDLEEEEEQFAALLRHFQQEKP